MRLETETYWEKRDGSRAQRETSSGLQAFLALLRFHSGFLCFVVSTGLSWAPGRVPLAVIRQELRGTAAWSGQ